MNQKGISPLIASVLLIAFTVALGTLVMGWLSGTVGSTTETVGSKITTAVGCSDAAIEIVHVYVNSTISKNAFIVVKNAGFYNFTTSITGKIYLNNGSSCSTIALTSLTAGEVKLLNVTASDCPAFTTSTFDRAVVNTECGGVSDTMEYSSSTVTIS